MNDHTKYCIADSIRITCTFVIFVCALIFMAYGTHLLIEAVKLLNWHWYVVCASIVVICVIAFWATDFIFPINKKPDGYGGGDGR